MFPPIEYLEWIAGRPERATYDLASSDLLAAQPTIERPPTDREDSISDLESLLAAEYGVDPEQVLVTAGGTHANFVAFATAIDSRGGVEPADNTRQSHVLVEKPGYEPLWATPVGLGANVDRFVRPAGEGFSLSADRFSAAVAENTSLVVVTNRHNPSGAMASRSTLKEVASVAEDAGATLLVDEVYAPFSLEPYAGGAFGGPTAAGVANTIVTGSVTKFFGLGSLRIGWLIGPEEFVTRARSVAWHVPAVSRPNAAIVADVLEDATTWGDRSNELLATNYDLLSSFVSDRPDLAGFVAPGCPYAFLSHIGVDRERTDGDRVVEVADEQGLLVVPGRFFDLPDRFRVSLGGAPDEMRDALGVLDTVLDSL